MAVWCCSHLSGVGAHLPNPRETSICCRIGQYWRGEAKNTRRVCRVIGCVCHQTSLIVAFYAHPGAVQGTECSVQSTKCRAQSAEHRVQSSEHRALGTECRAHSAAYSAQSAAYSAQSTVHYALCSGAVIGHSVARVGHSVATTPPRL